MSPAPIELLKGELHVPNSVLWLDAKKKSACAFVSHAHSDHVARHERVIATRATAALVEARLGPSRKKTDLLPVSYREPFGLGDLTVELFPAGHVLGSAQIRIARNGVSLCYTGDFCMEPSATAEPAEVVECDYLVMESTFGLPRYAFPPKAEVLAAVRRFVDEALADGCTPVLLGYTLGKSQEILKHLSGAGYRCRAHPALQPVNRVYEAMGVDFPLVKVLGPDGAQPGEVVVAPPHLRGSSALARLRRRRTAILTGWALDQGARFMYRGVDAAFPLSDHADFPALLRYARASGARKVFTVHGYADELAAALRREGIRAEPLRAQRQLELL